MVRKESTKKQQNYEAKPDPGRNFAIKFCMLKIQEFPILSDKKESVENCCDSGLNIAESFYQRKEEFINNH